MKVLIISGHPTMKTSNTSEAILEEAKRLFPEAEVSNLQTLYPNYQIDVTAEQTKLVEVDVIVWRFPVNWYSLPALLEKWLDNVFSYGFAYGDNKLAGKKLILSFTTGTPEEACQHGSAQNYPFIGFLNIHRQTASHCRLLSQGPVISYGVKYIPEVMPKEASTTLQQRAKKHAVQLVARIKELD